MRKKWLIAAVAIIVIAAAVGGYGLFHKKSAKPANNQVNEYTVKNGNISDTVSGSGTAAPIDTETIRALDDGQVNHLLVQVNDHVKKGQKLMTYGIGIDYSSQITQTELNLQKDQIDLTAAEQSLMDAMNTNLSSSVDTLKNNIVKLKINIEQTRATLQNYKAQMVAPAPVVSPIDGVVTALSANVNEQVKSGDVVATVTDYQHLQLVIQVDELDINKVKAGQTVAVTFDSLPNQAVTGKVSQTAEEGKASNGVSVYDVTIQLPVNSKIKAGMTAEAVVKITEKNNVPIVPIQAVQQIRGRNFVQISTPQGIQRKPVQVGVHDTNNIEITKGLKAGDKIVLSGGTVKAGSGNSKKQGGNRGPGGGFGGGLGGFGRGGRG